jgi:MoaA/NifB/PqqE/SkfB family radical SAM enzyme
MRKLIPRIVRWDVTGMCNLACMHCYSARKQPPDLNIKAIIGIINILLDHGLSEVNLSGREPTMRNDITDIVNWCYAHNITVNMTTNGTLLNHAAISQIASAVHTIVFSVDGASSSTHDRIRGKGNFKKTIENIKTSVGYKASHNVNLRIGISCTLHKRNHLEMAHLINLCKSLNIDFLSINPISFCGSAVTARDIFYLNPKKTLYTWNSVCKAYQQSQSDYDLYLGTLPMEARLMNIKYNLNLPIIQNGCSAGNSIYINPHGEALPCYMLPPIAEVIPTFSIYLKPWTILREPLTTAVKAFEPFIAFTRSHSLRNNEYCKNCPEATSCSPCPLFVSYDSESLKRCQIARDEYEDILARICDSTIVNVKRNVSWSIHGTQLKTYFQKGDYTSEKEFNISPVATSILSGIIKRKSIGDIKREINVNSFNTSPTKIDNMIADFIKYLIKEDIAEIRSNV